MVETNFLTAADRAKIFISDSLEEIGAFIDSYEPPMIRQYKTSKRGSHSNQNDFLLVKIRCKNSFVRASFGWTKISSAVLLRQ